MVLSKNNKIKFVVLLLLSIALIASSAFSLVMLFNEPVVEEKVRVLCTYEGYSRYNYVAHLIPNIIYDNASMLGPGEGVLFLSIVRSIDVNYSFTFRVSEPASTVLTYSFKMVIVSPGKWRKTILTTPKFNVKGNNTVVINENFTFNIGKLLSLIRNIEDEIEVYSGEHDLLLIANIIALSVTRHGMIRLPINHTLRLNFRHGAGDRVINILNLEHRAPGQLTGKSIIINEDVRNKLNISYVVLGVGLFCLAPATYIYVSDRRKFSRKTVDSVVKPLRDYLIEVGGSPIDEASSMVVDVDGIDALRKIAEGLGRPVLMRRIDDYNADLYVIDGNLVYKYSLSIQREVED